MSREQIDEVKSRVMQLQEKLGCKIQASIYSGANYDDDFKALAHSSRMSVIAFQKDAKVKDAYGGIPEDLYAVRIAAEDIGEIPFPLLCEAVYELGNGENSKPAFSDHTLAMASLVTAVTSSLDPDQLYNFLVAAKEQDKITDDQFLLATKHFLTTEEE